MKTELLRHINILKTIPEIKESIEELNLGCWISQDGQYYQHIYGLYSLNDKGLCNLGEGNTDSRIIGQVEERHLRLFLEKKAMMMCINNFSQICALEKYEEKDKPRYYKKIVSINNTKPYQEQSEEFFKRLNDWIEKEFTI